MSRRKPAGGGRRPNAGGVSNRFHRRNRHQGHYDFPRLVADYPALKPFLTTRPDGEITLDFADVHAVRALNSALMRSAYEVVDWTVPAGYLCPPIPGRADYVHGLADLLAHRHGGRFPVAAECVHSISAPAPVASIPCSGTVSTAGALSPLMSTPMH